MIAHTIKEGDLAFYVLTVATSNLKLFLCDGCSSTHCSNEVYSTTSSGF